MTTKKKSGKSSKGEKSFWFGKRVLVTGGDGFAASHLVKALLKQGAVVVTTIRHNRPLSTLKLISDSKEVQYPDVEMSNLYNYQQVRRICDRHQIDTIYHLAATAIVSNAANSPMSTIENNITPTLNLLEVARVNKIPRVIIASTDKSYGDHAFGEAEKLPYKENYALRGLDVYSASKVCTDMIAQTYAFQFGLRIAISRAANFYGPGDLNFTRLIPRTIMRLLAGEAPVINKGNSDVLREYVYVDDIIRAYLALGENMDAYYGEHNKNLPKEGAMVYGWPAFNFGSYTREETKDLKKCEKIKSVTNVIDILRKKIKNIAPIMIEKPANFIEIPDQYLDSTKLRTLGFKPSVSFEEGVTKTINWYKKNYDLLEKAAYQYIK